jgi:AraC-like DNA-binding protein
MTPPFIDHKDLIVHRSDRSGFTGLDVIVFELPACAWFDSDLEARDSSDGFWAYTFGYRPRAEKGDTWVTLPSLGLAHRRVSRDDVLLIPPQARVKGEWANAAGRTARFRFSPRLIEAVASKAGFPPKLLQVPSSASFFIDQRLEFLCRLLMEETQNNCRLGPLYFEGLARALAVGMITQLRDRDSAKRLASLVPAGIRIAIQRLEDRFSEAVSIAELADQAQLSHYHFARTFQKVTGYTPHQYLLHVRMSRARELMTQRGQAMPLAEVAAACGFFDQAHFARHFRRFFGTTPTTFLRQQERTSPQQSSYTVSDPFG